MPWIETTSPKVFTEQPTPPYLIGDTWSTDDGVLICSAPKTLGEEFSADDWSESLGRDGVSVSSVTRYYKLASSKPSKPTANPPSGWQATEPAYTEGSTNSLYTCELTVFSDDTWSYSDVSLSSSYEAAKTAYNQAVAAGEQAVRSKTFYAASNTAAATAAKTTASSVDGFTLFPGVCVRVKFTYANTNAAPTLNFSGTGAKAMRLNGAAYAYWLAGATVDFVYDGTYYQVANVPLYGASSTIGNPTAGNVYTDADGISLRKGTTVLAKWAAGLLEIGKGIATATIDLLNGLLKFAAHNENGQKFAQMTSNDNINIASSTGGVSITGLQSNGNLTEHGIGIVKAANSDPNALDVVAAADTFDLFADNPRINGNRMVRGTPTHMFFSSPWPSGLIVCDKSLDNKTISIHGNIYFPSMSAAWNATVAPPGYSYPGYYGHKITTNLGAQPKAREVSGIGMRVTSKPTYPGNYNRAFMVIGTDGNIYLDCVNSIYQGNDAYMLWVFVYGLNIEDY